MARVREVFVPGATLKVLRELCGERAEGKAYSQKRLAELTDGEVSHTMIALIELGDRQPSRETAELIAQALGLEVEQLVVDVTDLKVRRHLVKLLADTDAALQPEAVA